MTYAAAAAAHMDVRNVSEGAVAVAHRDVRKGFESVVLATA